jgi:hypothetical protein
MMPQRARYREYWGSYSLLHWLLAVAALIFLALWFLSVIASGFTIPDWVPPTGALCLALSLWIP